MMLGLGWPRPTYAASPAQTKAAIPRYREDGCFLYYCKT